MDYHAEAIASWDANAEFWSDSIGIEGNKYWKALQEPSLRRLLSDYISSGKDARALDFATGNGLTARWLANNGCAHVLATDGTVGMLEQAKKRASTSTEKEKIDYKQLDVTDSAALEELSADTKAVG
jgi:2-polyprenyl-3-methyl-5-hydroxy-6-metoxy-1,4-benzoquinol methylase